MPAYSAGNRISLGDDYYNPKVKTVSKGTRVVWVNNGGDPHTVTTGAWSRRLDPGSGTAVWCGGDSATTASSTTA